jgi:hypothetical protein
MMMISIELDSVCRYSTSKEYRNINRASCTYNGDYYESVSDDNNIRKLIALMPCTEAHSSAIVSISRRGTKVFEDTTLKAWLNPQKQQLNAGLAAYNESRKGATTQ